MGTRLPTLIALLLASPLFALACGGSGSSSGASKTPEPAATSSSATPDLASSPATTTTMTLGDGGDLQGAKLETKTTSTTATPDAKSDAARAPHKGEPGRGVDDIRAIVMARRDEVRTCYDRSLKDHPGIEGDVNVKWVIDPKGAVTEIGIDEMKSSIAEPTVRKCIIDVIRKIKFAESAKGFETRASYPFNFNPRSGGRVGAPEPGHR